MRMELHLCLPAETRLLSRTRQTVAGYLADAGADDEVVADVVLAVDEACANAIEHGSGDDPDAAYALHAHLTPAEIRIAVVDHGLGTSDLLSHAQAPAPVPAEAESGRGLNIIRELMTDVSLTRDAHGRGTVLRMARTLS